MRFRIVGHVERIFRNVYAKQSVFSADSTSEVYQLVKRSRRRDRHVGRPEWVRHYKRDLIIVW